MVIKDPRGPPRYGLIGIGLLLVVAAAGLGWMAIKSWREGSPATDYVVMAVVCAVVSAIFLFVGRRLHKQATGDG